MDWERVDLRNPTPELRETWDETRSAYNYGRPCQGR